MPTSPPAQRLTRGSLLPNQDNASGSKPETPRSPAAEMCSNPPPTQHSPGKPSLLGSVSNSLPNHLQLCSNQDSSDITINLRSFAFNHEVTNPARAVTELQNPHVCRKAYPVLNRPPLDLISIISAHYESANAVSSPHYSLHSFSS